MSILFIGTIVMGAMILVVGVMLAIGVVCEIRSWKNWGRDIEWAEEAIDRARTDRQLEDEWDEEEGDGCEIEEDDEYDRKLFGGGK